MCLPTRRTRWMVRPVRASARTEGAVLKGSGLLLNQVDTMCSPAMRACTPFATVSTSGSSGMVFRFSSAPGDCRDACYTLRQCFASGPSTPYTGST